MQLTVSITADDIRFGSPRNPSACPIARAMRPVVRDALELEAFNQFVLRVLRGRVDVTTAGRDWTGSLPAEASRFVRSFDEEDPVEPVRFTVDLTPR